MRTALPRTAFLLALLLTAATCLAQGDAGALNKLLERMTAAAQKADKEGFLACLDLSDPFFKQEQSAWCDDLVKNGVKDVRFSTKGGPTVTDDALTADLVINYTSNVGAATKGTQASWPARFTKKNGKLLYAGEDWQELKGDNFRVLYWKGDEHAARLSLEAFPPAREHVNQGFNVNPGFQQIKLFTSMDHLKATVYLNQPDPILMGWNEPGESIKFMHNYARDVKGWTAAYGHEYGHVATWEYGPGMKHAPWWVSEGVAELAAEDLIPRKREALERQIRRMAANGTLVKWDEIASYDNAAQPVKRMAYTQGHHMLGYISEKWGREGRTRWLKAMGAGKSLDQATIDVMGLCFADLDREWRGTLPHPDPTDDEIAAAEEGIDATLAAMEQACLKGDAAAYMKNIYEGDREFVYEQKYFANDASKKPAHEIELTFSDLTLRGDVAEAKLTWTWKMAADKNQRTVSFDARFIREDRDGKPVWLYAGEVWQRKVAPGAVVMYDDGLDQSGEEALKGFALVREHVETGFNMRGKDLPNRTQKIKLYASMKHLQLSICLSYENGLGGWNEPNEPIKLLVRPGSRSGGLRNVIAHEYGHCATFELGPKANNMPWWILEGVADLAAEKYSGKGGQFIERQAKAGKLAPWDELADFETVKPQYQMYVYQQGHHMLGYISDRWGRDKRVAWLTSMANGKTLDEATREVLGRPFAQLDQEWRASLPQPEPKKDDADEDKAEAAAPAKKADKEAPKPETAGAGAR
ncbi:MAG TPA: hypothetical protein VD997_03870 [Phycisphaerales bacterium]|nr:hypothetical protein [Phycisphaerales bacterium]